MNVILDTNAIKYYYQIEIGESVNIKLDGKKISNSKFAKLCRDASAIYVMSESYFELFFQSYKKDKNLQEFQNIYRFLFYSSKGNKAKFLTINDIFGFYFDVNKLVDSINYGKPIDLKDYIGIRVEQEKKIMCDIIMLINYAVVGTVLDTVYDVQFPIIYWYRLFGFTKQELEKIYNQYYFDMSIEIKEFENQLDTLIYDVLFTSNNTIDILAKISNNNIILPYVNGKKCGAKYANKILINLNSIAKANCKKKVFDIYEQNVDDFMSQLIENKGYTFFTTEYLKHLCMSFATGRKIRKNDIPDYAMVKSLNKEDAIFKEIKAEDTIFITFDTFVNGFCKDRGILYKEEIYNSLFE